jgi:hypothetical protein
MSADFWQAVIVEGIKAAAAIMVAVLGLGYPVLRRLRKLNATADETRTAAVQAREQVKNDHGSNLRDDVDDLHDDVRTLHRYASENRAAAQTAAEMATANQQAIGAVAVELRRLAEAVERAGGRRRRRWFTG